MAGGRSVKTRELHRDVRAMDKAVVGMERVKHAYIQTKESAEGGKAREKTTPIKYAEDQALGGMEGTARESIYQIRKQGGKALNLVRRNQGISSKEKQTVPFSEDSHTPFYQPKKQAEGMAKTQAQRQAAVKRIMERRTVKVRETSKQTVKTLDQGGRTVKGLKIKTIKTAEQTSHKAVKTTGQAAKSAQVTAKAARETARRTMASARKAAQTGAYMAKAAAKASAAAVKGIIAATKALMTAVAAGGWIAVMLLLIVILFGGVLSMVGGGNSSAVSPVSAEVTAYEPVIRRYADEYGIPEYVELIKAVMMQESGGQGLDPMQSSESGFNTEYPRERGGITDPEYSIACGVQELGVCLESAGVESPIDMEHIKLALQGYNFGAGYISWAKSNYGGYSVLNAAEFSERMAEQMGWDSYGDRQYVPHVLRYYVFGRIQTGTGSQAMVQAALTQEGNRGETYWSWYGFDSEVEWCACFVSWVAEQCGYLDNGAVPKFSLCSDGVEWFDARGQFEDGSYVPVAGDIIFFDWEEDGGVDHVGIVESVANGVVHTIEGNSGNAVKLRNYFLGDSRIYGYGILRY